MTYHIRDVHTVLALEPKFTRPGYSDLPLLKMINIEQGSPTGHLAVPRVSVRCVLKIKVVNERDILYTCTHVKPNTLHKYIICWGTDKMHEALAQHNFILAVYDTTTHNKIRFRYNLILIAHDLPALHLQSTGKS